jgi:ribonuclease Z
MTRDLTTSVHADNDLRRCRHRGNAGPGAVRCANARPARAPPTAPPPTATPVPTGTVPTATVPGYRRCRDKSRHRRYQWKDHHRQRVEWNGLSLIFTSDTRPETVSIRQANNGGKGVDVFIHEMSPAQELGVMKTMGLTWPDHSAPGFADALDQMNDIVESAHTPQGAFGHLLSRIVPRPQLAVAMHFPVEDDIVECAYKSVRKHFPQGRYPELGEDIVFSTDLMVLKVKKGKNGRPPKIEQFMGEVSDYTWGPFQNVSGEMAEPKYPDPTAQLDRTNLILPGDDTYCDNGY